MALRAAHGFKQYQRQDLVGGRYSLVGTLHDNEYEPVTASVRLHPDFWINYLWKTFVGGSVLNATLSPSSPNTIRAYAHCGKPPSTLHDWESITTLILINLDNSTDSTTLKLKGVTSYQRWTMTSGEELHPFGTDVYLNGMLMASNISNGKPINELPVAGVNGEGDIFLPKLSVSFVVVEEVDSKILDQCE